MHHADEFKSLLANFSIFVNPPNKSTSELLFCWAKNMRIGRSHLGHPPRQAGRRGWAGPGPAPQSAPMVLCPLRSPAAGEVCGQSGLSHWQQFWGRGKKSFRSAREARTRGSTCACPKQVDPLRIASGIHRRAAHTKGIGGRLRNPSADALSSTFRGNTSRHARARGRARRRTGPFSPFWPGWPEGPCIGGKRSFVKSKIYLKS
jgi:hypothetical protein